MPFCRIFSPDIMVPGVDRGNKGLEGTNTSSPEEVDVASHMDPGGPIGPRSVLFFRKYFSSLARMCLP